MAESSRGSVSTGKIVFPVIAFKFAKLLPSPGGERKGGIEVSIPLSDGCFRD